MATSNVSYRSISLVKQLCENGHFHDALSVVGHQDKPVCSEIFYLLINWSIRYKNLSVARKIHGLIIENGLEADNYLGNNLIRMFGLLGSLPEINQILSKLTNTNAFTWSTVIGAFANLGYIHTALSICHSTNTVRSHLTDYILTTMLKACSSIGALHHGKMVHNLAVSTGLESMVVVVNALVDMYFKCGSIEEARKVFDNTKHRDVVTWTAALAGYAQLNDGAHTLKLFSQMKDSGVEPNRVTYTGVLRACASMSSLIDGRLIHAQIIEHGFDHATVIGNTMIDMYAKCSSLQDALQVFNCLKEKNIVSWTVLLEAYSQSSTESKNVIIVFERMLREGWKTDVVLFLNLLKACNEALGFDELRLIHLCIVEDSLELDESLSSSLVSTYMNHGTFEDAFNLYLNSSSRSVVMCTAMITGLAEGNQEEEALQLFWTMVRDGVEPDEVCFISVLKACSNIGAIFEGRIIHAQIVVERLEERTKIGSCLVDFYSKSGSLMDARRVFNTLVDMDAVGWTAMIAGYVDGRDYASALQCFTDMQKKGIEPDEVTCICVLSAYTHMGLVDEGCHFFMLMRDAYDISPGWDHYDCMTNLLGHVGDVNVAGSLLNTLPFKQNSTSWISLLGHCSSYGNVEYGAQCFSRP